MEEFLINNYKIIIHSFEFLAAVTGIILYRKFKLTAARFFIYFLIYAFFIDLIGNYTSLFEQMEWLFNLVEGTVFENNYWWFQIFWTIASPIFFLFFYYRITIRPFFKKYIIFFCVCFFIISMTYLLYNWKNLNKSYFPFIDLLSLLSILFTVFNYYYEVLISDKIFYFYRLIYFYVFSAILIFWIIITPMTFYELYFSKADWNFILLKWQIFLFAIIFMYTTFTIGLIVSKPEES